MIKPHYHIDLKELAAREGEQVEWKENVASIPGVVQTITAFANDFANLGGGYVVCGVRETKDAHGFQKMDIVGLTASRYQEVENRVLAACRDFVVPSIAPLVVELPADDPGRRVLVFVVPATSQAHTFRIKGDTERYYMRLGSQTSEARGGILRELLVRKGAHEPWDRRAHPDARIDDLDLLAFRELLQALRVWDPKRGVEEYLSADTSVSPMVPSFCVREALTGELRPRHFALLLFGRDVQRFFPEAHAIFSLYPGTDRSDPFSERLEVTGTLPDQIKTLIERLNIEAYLVMDKTDPETPNLVKYPQRALHEAVVNALVHRDYEAHQPVRVATFGDRIEMFSPGSLPSAVKAEKFLQGRAMPFWRNQALSWFMNKLQLAQAEGQGIATIFRTMREEGCPKPEFELTPESVSCRLPAHPRHTLMRDLRAVERAVVLSQYKKERLDEARERLVELIERDPFNFRVVELFCEVQRAVEDLTAVHDFVVRHESRLTRFPASAQLQLAEALQDLPKPRPEGAEETASKLLRLASQGQFEEYEARRIVAGLLRSGQSQEAMEFVDRALVLHPAWNGVAAIRQLRGRCLLRLARQCTESARNPRISERLRQRAWDECRRFFEEAERDLRAAHEHEPRGGVKEDLERDFETLGEIRLEALAEENLRGD